MRNRCQRDGWMGRFARVSTKGVFRVDMAVRETFTGDVFTLNQAVFGRFDASRGIAWPRQGPSELGGALRLRRTPQRGSEGAACRCRTSARPKTRHRLSLGKARDSAQAGPRPGPRPGAGRWATAQGPCRPKGRPMAGLKADHRAAKAAWSGTPDRCCPNMLPVGDSRAVRGLGKPVDQRYDVESNQDRGQSNQPRSLRGQKIRPSRSKISAGRGLGKN